MDGDDLRYGSPIAVNAESSRDRVPPHLIAGRSALWWTRATLLGVGVAGLLIILGAVASYLAPHPTPGWLPLMAGAILVLAPLSFVAPGLARIRTTRREAEAGYTTLWYRYYHLWQLDPKTGEVLRRPGERTTEKAR